MPNELTLEEIHQETLPIIEFIDKLCEKLGVKYTAWYGSMLGTIRHKGFIPWDDDFDMAMLRPDYDTFVRYCKEHEDELGSFKLVDKESSADYPYNLARFCDVRYRMETPEKTDAGMGIFVDIYPLDPVGNDGEEARKRIQWRKKLYNIGWSCAWRKAIPETKKGFPEKALKTLIYLWAKGKTTHDFYRKYDQLARVYPYENSQNVAVVVWEMSFRPMPKAWFEDLVELPFETIRVKVPREYDRILRQVYGDYMQLPPKESQCPTHSYKIYRR